MEYLYLNIHTGAYWTSTRNEKMSLNSWENPVVQLTVFSCHLDKHNLIHLSYYELEFQAYSALHSHNIAVTGLLFISEKHRDRFRWISSYPPRFITIDTSLPRNLCYTPCVIQPLDGNRMPEPGEILNIIPEGANVKAHR